MVHTCLGMFFFFLSGPSILEKNIVYGRNSGLTFYTAVLPSNYIQIW